MRRCRRDRRRRTSFRCSRRAELPAEQPLVLVSAEPGPRLRHGDAAHHRAAGYSASASGQPAGAASEVTLRDLLTRASRQGVRLPREPAAALPRVRRQPVHEVAETTLGVPDVEGHRVTRADTRHDDAGHGGEPAAARPRPRHDRADRRHPAVLRVAGRRCAVRVGDDRAGRERPAGRPQPRLLRRAQQPAAARAR